MTRLYLDVCTLSRPFDDQTAMRIRLETDAYYLILQYIQDGSYELIVSPVHTQEVVANPDAQQRAEITTLLDTYGVTAQCDLQNARLRASQLYALKFGVGDAAHIAFAEATADYFISCDDRLLKRCRRNNILIPAMNPVEFCLKENLQ